MKNEIITNTDYKSPVAEMFRTLRTNIEYMNQENKVKTILVTSGKNNEGKSFISSNLAVTFAKTDKKVLLIDANMRNSRQANLFNISSNPGLADFLTNESNINLSDCIQKTDIDNLEVLVAGNKTQNPSDLLDSKKMLELLNDVKNKYDIVLVDSVACSSAADSIVLSTMVDSTIVVATQNETKKEDLEETIKSIKNVGGNIQGIVFNKTDLKKCSKKRGK